MKRNWYWFVFLLLPFISFVALVFHSANGIDMMENQYIDVLLENHFSAFSVSPLHQYFANIFNAISWSVPSWSISCVSYCAFILILRIFYEVIVFLPQFALSIFERRMKK